MISIFLASSVSHNDEAPRFPLFGELPREMQLLIASVYPSALVCFRLTNKTNFNDKLLPKVTYREFCRFLCEDDAEGLLDFAIDLGIWPNMKDIRNSVRRGHLNVALGHLRRIEKHGRTLLRQGAQNYQQLFEELVAVGDYETVAQDPSITLKCDHLSLLVGYLRRGNLDAFLALWNRPPQIVEMPYIRMHLLDRAFRAGISREMLDSLVEKGRRPGE